MKHQLRGEMASRRVWLDGKELLPGPSQKIWNHSPDGFNWGYGGSGPAQLALAICLKLTRDRDIARALHQAFKRDIIAILPQDDFNTTFDWHPATAPMWEITGRCPICSVSERSHVEQLEREVGVPIERVCTQDGAVLYSDPKGPAIEGQAADPPTQSGSNP